MTDDKEGEAPEALRWEIERLQQENAELRRENTELSVAWAFRVLDSRPARDCVAGFLRNIREHFAAYSAKYATIEEKREVLVLHLASTNEFIRFFDPVAPTGMLSDVACALVGAKNGTKTPLFTPAINEKRGRPPLAIDEQMNRAGAALAVTCLMESGHSLTEALRYVSDRTGWSSDDLKSFRRKVATDNFANGIDSERWSPARKIYGDMLTEVQQQAEQAAAAGSPAARKVWREAAEAFLLSVRANGWTGKRVT